MHEDDHESLPDPTGTRPVERLQAGRREPHVETLAEELPVALVYNGISHAVMLASPADLEDFALGFSLSEGIIDSPDDLLDAEILPADLGESVALAGTTERGLSVELKVTLRCFMRLKERRRTLAGRTGCGLCGVDSLDGVARCHSQVARGAPLLASAIFAAVKQLDRHQPLRQSTGAAHAAAWVNLAGDIELAREDVGRHNALDKLIGARAKAGADNRDGFALVSSRASYEMVQKSALAGIGALAAMSAPTALAVRLAEETGVSLVGFARQHSLVVYAGGEYVHMDIDPS